ncbi:MAG TPA: ABC transporter ATP-binding protein [Planctomycetota bacterium]|nr:ABC transporter ATP-binding protein [Planctomycetota bacterium]
MAAPAARPSEPSAAQSAPPSAASAAGPDSTSELAIACEGVSKCYQLYDKPVHRLWDLLHLGKPRYREFWALRQVYLEVRKGATVGLIGENGAGKSTLLKLLSGVTTPTTGRVTVRGRVTSLIELGAGFHPEFSGRENIRLACSILGLAPAEIAERTPGIIAFSELGDFVDRPVKSYSSGMYVRLGFSVATCVEPDILLIDEALSVGDEHFRGKCMRRLNDFAEAGGTTVFVSHDLGAVKQMCQHVALLHRGEIVEQGPAERVADAYLKRVKERGDEALSLEARGASEYPRWGSGELTVDAIELLDEGGRPSRVLTARQPCAIRLRYSARAHVADPVIGIGIYRSDGTYVNGSNHRWRRQPLSIADAGAGETGEVELRLDALPLLQGEYYLSTFVYDHAKQTPQAIDHREHAATFGVLDADHHEHGMLHLPSRWVLRRRRADAAPTEEVSEA